MSLRAPLFYQIPEQTAQVARAAFPKGNPYMRMRDERGPIYTNPDVAQLFPHNGQPAAAPAQVALISIMPFAEGLSDAQTADSVRGRIDWKYALALELTDAGFDSSVLSAFRTRLITGNAELLLFETMRTLFREQGFLKVRGRQRTDSTHVLAAIHVLNRLACIGETLRHALHVLATVAADWVQTWVPPVWFDRYRRAVNEYRLPKGKAARYELAAQIGTDGREVLTHLDDPHAPTWLGEIPAVQVLRQVWTQQFYAVAPDAPMRWRIAKDLPPAPVLISSPYDPEARYSKKRETEWVGYKVHLTETCDADHPHLLTDVQTTPSTTPDHVMTGAIQAQLDARKVVPGEHVVDAGYVTAERLVQSQQAQIDLVGPTTPEPGWQAKAKEGFAASCFVLDWEAQQATCPQGKTSVRWRSTQNKHGHAVVNVHFAASDCRRCGSRAHCVSSSRERSLTIHDQEHYVALQAARHRQHTDVFKARYRSRAGVEGTIAQATRTSDLRRSRYIGMAKTRLLHLLIAASLNFMRLAAWFADTRHAQTRRSAFAKMAPVAT